MYKQVSATVAIVASLVTAVSAAAGAQSAPTPPVIVAPTPPAPVVKVTPRLRAVAQVDPKPDGYIGITFSGDPRVERRGGKVYVSFPHYPAIVAVDAGSPADRGGLLAGDTIVQFNRRDVKHRIALYDMLRPGARFHVRVRRNGDSRNVTLTVAQNPRSAYQYRYLVPSQDDIAAEVRREVARAQAEALRDMEEARHLSERERAEAQREMQREIQREMQRVRTEAITPLGLATTGVGGGVAGAQVTALNDDLAELTRVRRGVFVVQVHPNTPAARTGLRGGDVITAVGDSAITDLAELRRAIQAEQRRVRRERGDRETKIEVVRRNRRMKLTLHW